MFGGKRQITFNGQTHIATQVAKFRKADATEFICTAALVREASRQRFCRSRAAIEARRRLRN
jgi:hypothetical protein